MPPFDPTKYGAKLIGQNQQQPVGSPVGSNYTPSASMPQSSQSQQPQQQQPGFLQSMVRGVAQPFLKIGSSLASLGTQSGAIAAYLTGKQGLSDKLQGMTNNIDHNGIDYGYFGKATSLGHTGSFTGDVKEAVGTGGEIGSYLIPGSKVINNPILRGATQGAVSGGLYGASDALSQGGGVGDVVKGAVEGGLSGGAAGGVISSVAPIARGVTKTSSAVGRYATSNLTGLSKDTINTILTSPEKLSSSVTETLNREYLGNKVYTAIKSRLGELSSTGKEYQPIRDAAHPVEVPTVNLPVQVPNPSGDGLVTQMKPVNEVFLTVLKKYGLDLDPASGKILTSPDSVPLSPGDVDALQRFYQQYGQHTKLSSNSFLNVRQAADGIADFGADPNTTDISNKIGKDLRATYDEIGKSQIPGLKELDSKFAPEKQLLTRIRTDYLNPDGTLKDNALNKIANLGNKGKSIVLQRLEKITPGIGEDINILRAVEDIKDSSGIKIGTYARSGITGLVLGGGNPMAALLGIVLSTPQVAVPIIKTFARAKNVATPLVDNVINRMKVGKSLSEPMKRLIYSAFASYSVGENNKKEIPQEANQNTDAYLKSLGI